MHRRVGDLARERGLSPPSYSTVRGIVAAIDPGLRTLALHGDSAYRDRSELTAGAREAAAATKKMADALAGYQHWPKDVKPLVDELVAGDTAEYGRLNRLAASDSLDDFHQQIIEAPDPSGYGDFAEQIRQKLGLPARTGD